MSTKELDQKADALLQAANAYFEEVRKIQGMGAVIWLQETNGNVVIFTRGEYKSTLMQNIDLIQTSKHIYHFNKFEGEWKDNDVDRDAIPVMEI